MLFRSHGVMALPGSFSGCRSSHPPEVTAPNIHSQGLVNPSDQRECYLSRSEQSSRMEWVVCWTPGLQQVSVEKVLPITDGWGLDGGEQEGPHFTP